MVFLDTTVFTVKLKNVSSHILKNMKLSESTKLPRQGVQSAIDFVFASRPLYSLGQRTIKETLSY